MKKFIKNLLRESLIKEEYQVRDIDGPIYYKRPNKYTKWSFITEEEFKKNKKTNNIIEYKPLNNNRL